MKLFATSVNTPLKPPANAGKDNQQSNGLLGRKISISNQASTPGGYGPLSPTTTRGSGRRRETSESYPFQPNPLSSPTTGYGRDEQRAASPPPSLMRRRTDLKDATKPSDRDEDGDDKGSSTSFGTLKRHQTGPLSAGFGTPSSPWSNAPQSAGLSPMGSFGNFGLGQQSSASDKRPGLGSGRSESRFKNVLGKDSGEDLGQRSVERKASMSSLSRVNENESWRPQQLQDLGIAPPEEADEDLPSRSAVLGVDTEVGPPNQLQGGVRRFGTPSRSEYRDEYGFGAFGMTSDSAHGFGQGFLAGRDAFQQTPSQQRHVGGQEPMSPTDTNPYQSPEQHGIDHLTEDVGSDDVDIQNAQLPGLGGFGNDHPQQLGGLGGLSALPNLGRAPGGPGPASDRSQTSSAGPNRGFPSLGGLGQLGGVPGSSAWPVSQGGLGTQGMQSAGLSNAFGGGMFATSMGEMQSTGLAGLGGGSIMSSQSMGGSRMASMFPPAIQEQMRQTDLDREGGSGQQQFPGLSDLARTGESPYGYADQNEHELPGEQQPGHLGVPPGQQAQPITGQQQDQGRQQQTSAQPQAQQQPQQPGSSASTQPPPPQQRTMVMPDRMRWIYRDPQGQTQGPWTGLEMHDWYKAGFFSPELLVKKYEDLEYEPLAQLIRRIGNSREPFLVPQIGIPHGSASTNGPNSWAGSGSVPPGPTSAGGAQPPFASSFPSFGTTLTADQQNALERRKQEEQYLMARQKEHLAQAQMASRMHPPLPPGSQQAQGALIPGNGQLHHHSSAQSLHSQPSFGSMTSPTSAAYQPSPSQGPQGHQPGFFDNSFRATGQAGAMGAVGADVDSLGHIREEEIPGIMDRLNFGEGAGAGEFGAPGQPFAGQSMHSPSSQAQHDRQVQQMLQDRARLRQEQVMQDAAQQATGEGQIASDERFQQFQQLQGQAGVGVDARFQPAMGKQMAAEEQDDGIGSPSVAHQKHAQPKELTLTEQVQKAASAQQSPVQKQPGLPQPFPPAPSQSPLPAPAAQRTGRQSVADQLQTEQRDLSQTPSVDTPSAAIAPWAKEPTEAQKGPSLKEIQEMEAKEAAEAEAMASASRRAALQKQMEAESQVIAPAPGLPASASWAAAGGSPATPTGGASSAWVKAAPKTAGPTTAKSMAQIQKEEEARKKKLAAATANAQLTAISGVANTSGGKSYANLAGKISMSPAVASPAAAGGAWTTVGVGGKAKTPIAPTPPAIARTVSSGVVPAAQSVATTVRKPPTRSSTMNNPGTVNAQEEFRKWAVSELRPDLNKSISGES